MNANNPDQDDFDPAFDETGEDFAYEEESFEEEGFSEEGWDENYDDGEEVPSDEPARPAKKKGGLFNVILIAAAVLGGGAFIYLKVLSGPAPPPVAAPAVVAEVPPPAPESVPVPAVQPEPAQTAAVVVPDVAPAPAVVVEAAPLLPAPGDAATEVAPAPTSESVAQETVTPAQDMAPVQQPVEVASAPPMPAPISTPEAAPENFNAGLPSAKDVMLQKPAAEQDVTMTNAAAAPVVSAGISDDAAKGIEQKLSVLITRLDTFEGRIANLESGLHQMSSTVAAVQSAPPPVVDLSSVNGAIQSLEKKVGTLEVAIADSAGVAVKKQEPVAASVPKEEPVFVPAAEPEPAPVTTAPIQETIPPPVAKAPVQETVPAAEKQPKAAEPPVKKAEVASWVLRSAQPGAAMVAPKSGGDMRSVKVGDSLSGLGRIVAIEKEGNRWVVRGTQGSLTH